eukprot:1493023-Rhodomonas_salina.1
MADTIGAGNGKALKYVWNDTIAGWETQKVKIVMEEEPFTEGGMRVAHKTWEVTGNKMLAQWSCKVLKTALC